MRNLPDSEPIDVVDLTIHAIGRSVKTEYTRFGRSLIRYKTRTVRVEIICSYQGLLSGLAGTIGTTKRQPNPATR